MICKMINAFKTKELQFSWKLIILISYKILNNAILRPPNRVSIILGSGLSAGFIGFLNFSIISYLLFYDQMCSLSHGIRDNSI